MSHTRHPTLIALCSATLLLGQLGSAWAQHTPSCEAVYARMQAFGDTVGRHNRLQLLERDLREQMVRHGCQLRRNMNEPFCRELLGNIAAIAAERRQLDRVQPARARSALRAQYEQCQQAAQGGIDPAAAALLGALVGGAIAVGVARSGRRGAGPQTGMPVHPRR